MVGPGPGGGMLPNWMLQSFPQAALGQVGPTPPDGSCGATQEFPSSQKSVPRNALGAGQIGNGVALVSQTVGGESGVPENAPLVMVYNPQAHMFFPQAPPPAGMFSLPPAVVPGAQPMRPQDVSSFISSMCCATGMTPAMLYNCLGASLAAGHTSPGYILPGQGPAQDPQVLSTITTMAQSESDANSYPNPGSAKNIFGPTPSMSGNAQAMPGSTRQHFLGPGQALQGTPREYLVLPSSTQNILEPSGDALGSAANASGVTQEGGPPNESSTQVSGTSNERPKPGFAGHLSQWEQSGAIVGTTAPQPTNNTQVINNPPPARQPGPVGALPPGSEDRLLDAPSLVSHISAGSNVWSPTPSPGLSPLLAARLPDFSPPFSALERFGSSSPSTPAFSLLERVASPLGLSPPERGGTFTLAEIFAEMGEGAGLPGNGSPVQNISLGSLAAANQGTAAAACQKVVPGSGSHGLPPGAGVMGNTVLGSGLVINNGSGLKESSGELLGAVRSDGRCEDLVSSASASMPEDEEDVTATAGEGAESAVCPVNLSWSLHPTGGGGSPDLQCLPGPPPLLLGSMLRPGSEISTFSMEQPCKAAGAPDFSQQSAAAPERLSTPPPSQLFQGQVRSGQGSPAAQEVDASPMQADPYHGASWQPSEGASPVAGPRDPGAGWQAQLEDACSPAGAPPGARDRPAADRSEENEPAARPSTTRKAPAKRKPKQAKDAGQTDAEKGPARKRVRKGKNKGTPGTEVDQLGAANPAQSPSPPSQQQPPPSASLAPAPVPPFVSNESDSPSREMTNAGPAPPALKAPPTGGTPTKEMEECRRRPEIEAILRLAHGKGGGGVLPSPEGKGAQDPKKKSPEEILREAFQASMAARARANPTGAGKREPCTEPQALAARARRERVNRRMRVLQDLVPGAANMTTENFLLEAVQYVSSLVQRVRDLTRPLPDCQRVLGEEAEARAVPGGSLWGWPQEPELLARGLQVVPFKSVSALAAKGGVLDALLMGQELEQAPDVDHRTDDDELDDLDGL